MSELLDSFARHNQIVRYISVAGTVILLYDYLLTIVDEVRLIWYNRWNTGKILFIATRYLCFVDTALVMTYLFDPQLDTRSCKEVYNSSAYLIVAGIFIAEVIMSIRTHALWGRSKKLLVFMVLTVVTGIAIIIVFYVRKANNIFWIPSPIPHLVPCNAQDADEIKVVVAFGLLMGYECIILILTIWIGVKQWKEDLYRSPLLMQFYKDGAVYFFIMFATSAANFAIRLRKVGNGDFYDILIIVQRVFHSILSARMILNLRHASDGDADAEGRATQLTALEFETPSLSITRAGYITESGESSGGIEGGSRTIEGVGDGNSLEMRRFGVGS